MDAFFETCAPTNIPTHDPSLNLYSDQEAPISPKSLGWRIGHLASDETGFGRLRPSLIFGQGLVSCLPYLAAKRIRAALYRMMHVSVGSKTVIYGKMILIGEGDIARRLKIGSRCRINAPCRFDLMDDITIGDDVSLGYGVTIVTSLHNMTNPKRRAGKAIGRPVTIGNGVWLAANVHVLPGVTIGDGAVIGAASVVTRDVPPHTLAVGAPARVVRDLSCDPIEQ